MDYYSVHNRPDWAYLHCCKHPFHQKMVGYKGSLPNDHRHYASITIENRCALNIVDVDVYNPTWNNHNRNMFTSAFDFLDEHLHKGCDILIHCNKGESRAPSIAMLYLAHLGEFNIPECGHNNFKLATEYMRMVYPKFKPKSGIYGTIENLWGNFL